MQDQREQMALVTQLNDKSRKAVRVGTKVIVPLKFDEDGSPLTAETFNPKKHLKSLSLSDLRFLKVWRESGWDVDKACKATETEPEKAKKLVRRLQIFKSEEERVLALADIPTPAWITAKHTENVFDGKLDDSQRDSLKELAKIGGAYKNNVNLTVTQNVFNLPKYDPETEKKLKEIADREAMIIQDAQVVNG